MRNMRRKSHEHHKTFMAFVYSLGCLESIEAANFFTSSAAH